MRVAFAARARRRRCFEARDLLLNGAATVIHTIKKLAILALAASLLGCASTTAPQQQAELAVVTVKPLDAQKLVGKWVGKWAMAGYGDGKFELIIVSADQDKLSGDANWYGTEYGDLKLPLLKAYVRDNVFHGEQTNDTSFSLKSTADSALGGTWSVGAYSGTLSLSRQ